MQCQIACDDAGEPSGGSGLIGRRLSPGGEGCACAEPAAAAPVCTVVAAPDAREMVARYVAQSPGLAARMDEDLQAEQRCVEKHRHRGLSRKASVQLARASTKPGLLAASPGECMPPPHAFTTQAELEKLLLFRQPTPA